VQQEQLELQDFKDRREVVVQLETLVDLVPLAFKEALATLAHPGELARLERQVY
jgi:Tfp pilus assembly protein PilN